MIALHVIRDPEVRLLAEEYSDTLLSERVVVHDCLNGFQREHLYKRCRAIPHWPKLILSVFRDSSVLHKLWLLEGYPMELEVCTPHFTRLASAPDQEARVEGSLDHLPHA